MGTTQKSLSPRQARWLEEISEFNFEIIHVPGAQNLLADTLSRLYSDEPCGTVHAVSEYLLEVDDDRPAKLILSLISAPCYTGSPLFLGAARKTKAPSRGRVAFPNAKQVVLRLKDLSVPLEGETAQLDSSKITEIPIETALPTEISSTELAEPSNPDTQLLHDDIIAESPDEEILSESPVSLTELMDTGDPTLDIHQHLKGRYGEDAFFKVILEDSAAYKNFQVSNELIFVKENDSQVLCIPDIMIGERRVREMLISHAHSILAHLGPKKTVTYLRNNVWWRGLSADVHAYCTSCGVCATSKSNTHAPYGLLNPLEVPDRPWETLGVDFMGPMPLSETVSGSYDMVMVIICHLTSMVHLIPTLTTYTAKDIAEVMFDHVYKHHSLPSNIVRDRDSLFTSIFWDRLNELTGTELRMSSAYHPQSDGATERANITMTQMLRQCIRVDQRDWVKH